MCNLDYCNSLLYVIIESLQGECNYMPVLSQLHWLPVEQHIHYKMALLVYRSFTD